MPNDAQAETANVLHFPGPDDRLLVPGADLVGTILTGTIKAKNLSGATFWECKFKNLDARKAVFHGATLRNLTIDKADFRGAILSDVRELHTAKGLETARFNDDTIVDSVDLDRFGTNSPPTARRLRQIRYAGRLKREHPWLYWPWQMTSACGRSWLRLLAWGLSTVVAWGIVYLIGSMNASSRWLPHVDPQCSMSGWRSAVYYQEFSAMTFASFNMPDARWTDAHTGAWVAAEVWWGLAFLGIFVTIVAVNMAARE